MKKNFLMWILTVIAALIAFFIAIISFFKNRNFFCHFKNEEDLIPGDENFDESEDLVSGCKVKNCEDCDQVCDKAELKEDIVKKFDYSYVTE